MPESRIPLEELARLPNFHFPTVSWGRDKVAFYWDVSGRLELHVLDLQTGESKQISQGEVPRSPRAGFVWRRDDQAIIFAKDAAGNEQHDIYQIDVATSEVTQLTRTPESQEYPIEVSPDDEWLIVATDQFGQLNLARMRLDDPQEYVQLTNYAQPVWGGGLWSPDGQWIAYTTNETDNLVNQDVYLMRADGEEQRLVLHVADGSQDQVAEWSPDGRFLAISSDAGGVNRPGLLNVETGEVRWLGQDGLNESAQGFSENGRLLACLRNQNAEIRPVIYDIETGDARECQFPSGVAVGSKFVDHDTGLITLYTTPTRRPELVRYDLADESYQVLIAADYGSIDPERFVTSEHIWYPSFDGREIPALLHVPPDIAAGEKRPTIVIVHGGPTGQFFQMFDPYAQFLVDQGYVVFKPNIRGSTGYGVEFRDLNRYDIGGGDLEDVACGAAYLKTLPFVDPDRLGIFGGSYGGYMTYMQVVKKPDLWKAASAAVGITHWKMLYDDSMEHFKWYLHRLFGDPEENASLYEQRSPLTYAHKLQAKLQMIHGVNDPRCPVNQAHIFRDRLLELGYKEGDDFKYVELTEQGHGSADIEQKIVWYTLLSDFMAKTL